MLAIFDSAVDRQHEEADAHREVHGFLLGVHAGDPHHLHQRFVIEVDLYPPPRLARSREQSKGGDYEGWLAARTDEKVVET